ncbi:MAG: hypothetical protein EXQ94_10460 [Alphaproteobacteria bacterium]|nr:hypothetical protein [Alphaproteobacteria bacterium]
MWAGGGFAEAIALRDGCVLATGAQGEIEVLAGPGTRRVELRGRLAIPAFHDAHMHLMSLGQAAKKIDLRPDAVGSIAEIVAGVAERARATAPGTWVVGRGYDHDRLSEKRHPTRWDLDRVAPDHPRSGSAAAAAIWGLPTPWRWPWPASTGRRPTRPAASSCARTASPRACCRSGPRRP